LCVSSRVRARRCCAESELAVRGLCKAGQDGLPALAVALPCLGGFCAEPFPAAMLEVDAGLAALVGEGDLDLRGRPVLLAARPPGEDETMGRLVGDDVGPLQLLALRRPLVDPAAGFALEDDGLGRVAGLVLLDRVLAERPPVGDPLGERLERVLDRTVDRDGALDRLRLRCLRAHPFLPSSFAIALKAARASLQKSSKESRSSPRPL